MKHSTNLESFGYKQELKRELSLGSLVFFGLAYINIIGAFTMYGIATNMTKGMFALAFLIAAISMGFTAFSYAKMSAAFPIAGSSYSYTQRSISPYAGFMVGWIIMLDYILLPITNFLLIGIYMEILIPSVPSWAWSLIAIILITLLNIKGVKLAANSDAVITIVNATFLLAFFLFMCKWLLEGNGEATFFSINGFINAEAIADSKIGWAAVLQATSVLCLCFLGFDAITTFAEEAIEPEKNIGRAIIIACLGAGGLFVTIAYFSQLSWPDAYLHLKSPDTGATELIELVAGTFMSYLFTALFMLGCIGSGIASQSSGARLLFVMGRDGGLPKILGKVNEKTQTPIISIMAIALVSCISMFTDLFSIASVINFGGLIAFTMVNICVIKHYYLKGKMREGYNIIKYLIAPGIGAIISITIWINLDAIAHILGGIWTVTGFVILAIQTKGFKKPPMKLEL